LHHIHTWKANLAGRQVLELGLIMQIFDGESTNVWNDNWVPQMVLVSNMYAGKIMQRLDNSTCRYLSTDPVFAHGQLYVVLSRSVSRETTWVLVRINILIDPTEKITKNIVYRNVFE
jgi:hypothetical protein